MGVVEHLPRMTSVNSLVSSPGDPRGGEVVNVLVVFGFVSDLEH